MDNQLSEELDVALAIAINEIEKSKGRVRMEFENLKEDYLRSDYRKHGITKAQCERRLEKRTGEILGHEAALSVLYRMQTGELAHG